MSLGQEIKRQMGLTKDPDRPVAIPSTGNFPKLTRSITPGYDSEQVGS